MTTHFVMGQKYTLTCCLLLVSLFVCLFYSDERKKIGGDLVVYDKTLDPSLSVINCRYHDFLL